MVTNSTVIVLIVASILLVLSVMLVYIAVYALSQASITHSQNMLVKKNGRIDLTGLTEEQKKIILMDEIKQRITKRRGRHGIRAGD